MSPAEPSADISQIRTDYKQAVLLEAAAAEDPFEQFARWMADALHAHVNEPTAMTVCTLGTPEEGGFPIARVVLLKGHDARGFVFYTNYESAKGRELIHDSRCSLVFFWPELERQVRIVGTAAKTTADESDRYFASRPRKSRLGAIASPQSEPISRADLDARYAEAEAKFPGDDATIPRPAHWGGFRVTPSRLEFWQGRASRMHDRLVYFLPKGQSDKWTRQRLAP